MNDRVDIALAIDVVGAHGIAVVGAVSGAADPAAATRELLVALGRDPARKVDPPAFRLFAEKSAGKTRQ